MSAPRREREISSLTGAVRRMIRSHGRRVGDADPEDLSWYHAPADWHLADLPASLDAFATTVRGRLFAR